jgi:phosphopantothenoylcysteine decarboxylase/phosphopantothenate--cysteine ligase
VSDSVASGSVHLASRCAGKTIALCVTGSIAAYKAAELARLLRKAGAKVLPIMSASATRFIGPQTLAGITGEPVLSDMWEGGLAGEIHVQLAERADVVVVVPATADVLARLAHGRSDDLVTAVALCARGPLIAAPAMHPRMWEHPATQRNVTELRAQGRAMLVGPVHGEVASGDIGMGRMAEPEAIAGAIAEALSRPSDLTGLKVVVTAGPTLEDIDPVRFIGNRSSGRMGFAVADRAAARGASVTLIAGPVSLSSPSAVQRVDVRGASAMRTALWEALGPALDGADALVMAAAVSDYRPIEASVTKIKKEEARTRLELVRNPDLLAEIGSARSARRPALVGFAVETEAGDALISSARRKLAEKHVDLVVANVAGDAFGGAENRATLVTESAVKPLPVMSKLALADILLDELRVILGRK